MAFAIGMYRNNRTKPSLSPRISDQDHTVGRTYKTTQYSIFWSFRNWHYDSRTDHTILPGVRHSRIGLSACIWHICLWLQNAARAVPRLWVLFDPIASHKEPHSVDDGPGDWSHYHPNLHGGINSKRRIDAAAGLRGVLDGFVSWIKE